MNLVSTTKLSELTGFKNEFFLNKKGLVFFEDEHYFVLVKSRTKSTYIWNIHLVEEALKMYSKKINDVTTLLERIG